MAQPSNTCHGLSLYALAGDGTLLWQDRLGIAVHAVTVYGTDENARVVAGSDDGVLAIYSREGRQLLSTQLDNCAPQRCTDSCGHQ